MSWLAIIGVLVQVLQAAGVFDWLTKWLESLFGKTAPTLAALPAHGELGYVTEAVNLLFTASRPGWSQPGRRLLHGLCWHVADRNHDLITSHVCGSRSGMPVDPANVRKVNGAEKHLFEKFGDGDVDDTTTKETTMLHEDCKSMVEDMADTFGMVPKAAGANTENIFFDGTLMNLIRQFNAAGVSNWIQWIPVVLQLISTIGPKIKEIFDAIQNAINQNKTPKDVLSDLIVAA